MTDPNSPYSSDSSRDAPQDPGFQAPTYGQPAGYSSQPGYGQQPGGTAAYGQQPAVPAYDPSGWEQQPAGYGAGFGGYGPPARKPSTVGIIAVVALVISVIIAGVGVALASQIDPTVLKELTNAPAGSTVPDDVAAQLGGWMMCLLASFVFGIWALIQGIVATVTKRGRPFGIIAIVGAVIVPAAVFFIGSSAVFAAAL